MRCKCDIKFGYDIGLVLIIVGTIKMFDNPLFVLLIFIGAILAFTQGHKFYG